MMTSLSIVKSARQGKSYFRQTAVNFHRRQRANNPNHAPNWGWVPQFIHPEYNLPVYAIGDVSLMFSPNGDRWLVFYRGLCQGTDLNPRELSERLDEVKAELVERVNEDEREAA